MSAFGDDSAHSIPRNLQKLKEILLAFQLHFCSIELSGGCCDCLCSCWRHSVLGGRHDD
jgi:hypothetical protein